VLDHGLDPMVNIHDPADEAIHRHEVTTIQ
jgi:hypothetical protein